MNFVLKNKDNKKEKLVFSIRISQDLAQRIEYALDHMSDDTDTNQ